jgi:hypothetical protein
MEKETFIVGNWKPNNLPCVKNPFVVFNIIQAKLSVREVHKTNQESPQLNANCKHLCWRGSSLVNMQ